jgi:hypothetical protein
MSFNMVTDFKLRTLGFYLGVTYLALTGGGGCNVFTDFPSTNTDQAIIDTATNEIDQSQWTEAIATLQTVSPATLATPAVQVLLATAYAGRGGLNLLNLSQSLQNAGAGVPFFVVLMQAFPGATNANIADEETAEGIMQGISLVAANRTIDQNVFMVFLEMAKLGDILSARADTLNDGVVDPTFDGCLDTTAADVNQVASALGNIIASVQASGLTVGSSLINTLTADCASFGGACAILQASAVVLGSPQQIFTQTLIGETALGIGLAAPLDTGICEIPPNGTNCHGSGSGLCPAL